MLLRAQWILPVAGEPFERGEVHVRDGRIVSLGPMGSAMAAPDEEVVDLGAAALMPGLVNAHSHFELTVMRGLLEDLAFRDWIARLTTIKFSILTPEDMLDSARFAYFLADPVWLLNRLDRLVELHGRETVNRWRELVAQRQWPELVGALLAEHYDPAYFKSMQRNFARLDAAHVVALPNIDNMALSTLASALQQNRENP